MNCLRDRQWRVKYDSDLEDLLNGFYLPALSRAVRYDRVTGYFSPEIFTLALRGMEGLVNNRGKIRLIVGCTLEEDEVRAIAEGEKLKAILEKKLIGTPLEPRAPTEASALELLSWLIAHNFLEIKLAVPCTRERQPLAGNTIFHAKAGIIEDGEGNRIAFNGSNNETLQGWTGNWESFHVFTSWEGSIAHVESEELTFAELWSNRGRRCLVVDVPIALRDRLLRFLPPNDELPQRLKNILSITPITDSTPSPTQSKDIFDPRDEYRKIWALIHKGPSVPGKGDRIGEVTSAIRPFPHQLKAFKCLYENWPPKLLIADEVGLGKTIQAGLLIRQAYLAGRAKRILILTPAAVMKQWQIELREKFNLNIPIYDGKNLNWCDCPALRALSRPLQKPVSRTRWHEQPLVIASSHLMRRSDRYLELTRDAALYDLIILDEAHHARRRGVSGDQPKGANRLLTLMQELRRRTKGLVLLTATPMQVSPIEVWDLLNLLGLPPEWDLDSFRRFFDYANGENPSHAEFEFMARLFRSVETYFGETPLDRLRSYFPEIGNLALKKILAALRDEARSPRKSLSSDRRKIALEIMKRNTPIQRLISRHTRELLRRYYEAGKISTPIAKRRVEDKFITLTPDERSLYEDMENYISTTYNNASPQEQNAVGFVMTIYRRRLASSFRALQKTIEQRLNKLDNPAAYSLNIEDLDDDELNEETQDEEEAENLERSALKNEERLDLLSLLEKIRRLPTDTKALKLSGYIERLQQAGYPQIIVFTQYTDTIDFLRQHLASSTSKPERIICFSGRGGECLNGQRWQVISREEIKRVFREGKADILLCTDAAAEGLNFQFCGALINYDMPWNPMRVEQRIGRIDRLGQTFAHQGINIVNLHYADTIETDVYIALRERIGLFSRYVGRLQPILSTLSGRIASVALSGDRNREELIEEIDRETGAQDLFDIDEVTGADLEDIPLTETLYDLDTLDRLLQSPDLLPPDMEVTPLGAREYRLSIVGMNQSLRITTDAEYFDRHSGSVELWSPGNVLFPSPMEELTEIDINSVDGLNRRFTSSSAT